MRILFLNLYFPPDTSATAKSADAIVRTLAASHELTVLCGRPSYDPTERRPWKLWQTERCATNSSATFTVIRVGSTDYPRLRMRRRILNYLTYTKLAFLRGLFFPCDAIFSMTDPPFEGIVAALLATLKRKPLLYDIQDLYPDMAIAGSIVQPGLLSRIWERLHRWTLHRANRIIVLGEDMRARLIEKGIDASKIHIVRSGIDLPPTSGTAQSLNPAVIEKIRGNSKFVLLHAGNLGFYGAWDTLIAAVRQLERENIALVFVGDGAARARLESLAKGAANIRFLPFFPSCEIPSVLAAPDAHIITIKRGLEGVVVPSKLFGILAAAKPIVAVVPPATDVATLGAQQNFALSADPDDPQAVAAAVRSLAADPTRLAAMSQAARAAATHYSRPAELATLTAIVSSLQSPG
ncbi:MAG TPA: glycosyltransferase family 4 protein [Candidatus Acidoferrum sp.]|jgi:glycosyltransferase involved in cell wall biosynthesis